MEARQVQALRERVDRLRLEVAELRASRERLVVAADGTRRRIERELHDGPQQHLIALAVNLQLVARLVDDDPAAAKELLAEMGGDVEQALDATARLAERVYPSLLDASGLAAVLRSAAATIGVSAAVDVPAGMRPSPDVTAKLYLCCIEALEHVGAGAHATVSMREDDGAVAFEITADGTCAPNVPVTLRDRVEALGGELGVQENGDGTRISGSLPLSR